MCLKTNQRTVPPLLNTPEFYPAAVVGTPKNVVTCAIGDTAKADVGDIQRRLATPTQQFAPDWLPDLRHMPLFMD
jgi:hypothetical protein